jgi:hypothetical protein
MITPAPTSKIAPHLARGILAAVMPATATKAGYVTIAVPNTSYELHLVPTVPLSTAVGKRVVGTIHVQARRIDMVETGGRFIEPVYGRPRRVQGIVVQVDAAAGTLTVDAAVPMVCKTDGRQKPSDFEVGQFVSMDVQDGATFTPER